MPFRECCYPYSVFRGNQIHCCCPRVTVSIRLLNKLVTQLSLHLDRYLCVVCNCLHRLSFQAEGKIQNSGRLLRTSPMKSLAFVHMGFYMVGLLPASLQAPDCMIASTFSSRVLIPSCMANRWNEIVVPMVAQQFFPHC